MCPLLVCDNQAPFSNESCTRHDDPLHSTERRKGSALFSKLQVVCLSAPGSDKGLCEPHKRASFIRPQPTTLCRNKRGARELPLKPFGHPRSHEIRDLSVASLSRGFPNVVSALFPFDFSPLARLFRFCRLPDPTDLIPLVLPGRNPTVRRRPRLLWPR